jgi:ParB-like chromosome segregation protein Spo0J
MKRWRTKPQILENLRREDVHPLDEAASSERLIASGSTIDGLSPTLDKPKAHIYPARDRDGQGSHRRRRGTSGA